MAKAMRAAKAMKAMKRVSKFAKGKLAKLVVFRGNKEATVSGLTKSSLTKNKNGKIVSKKASANGKKAYARIKGWTVAEGAEGSRGEGIPCGEEGDAPVQEGEGVLRPVRERRMSDSYLRLDQRDGACSGKWGSPTACLSEGCLLL